MVKGNLKPNDAETIRKNYTKLREELDPYNFLDFLFENKVVSKDEMEKINNAQNRQGRIDILLPIILDSGPGDAFNIFVQSLEKEYPHIVKLLRPEEATTEQNGASGGSIEHDGACCVPQQESVRLLTIGERVIWPSEKGPLYGGVVRWIGRLPDCPEKSLTVGVEFVYDRNDQYRKQDEDIGQGNGKYKDQRLFHSRQNHAMLMPLIALVRENDLLEK